MFNLELKCFNRFFYKNDYVVPRHTHPYYEMIYYVKGCGSVTICGEESFFYPGTVAFIKPDLLHEEKGCADTEVMFVSFEVPNLHLELQCGVVHDATGEIKRCLDEIESELKRKDTFYRQLMDIKQENVLALFARLQGVRGRNDDSQTMIEYAVNYIRMNCSKNISIRQLARDINYSYDYFRHLFKKQVGMSINKFIDRERVKYIKKLLSETDYREKEIADMCDFSSAAHLVKFFKNTTGETPICFRQRQQQKKDDEYELNELTYR